MTPRQIEALELLETAPVVEHAEISARGLTRSVTALARFGYTQWIFPDGRMQASSAKITTYGKIALDRVRQKEGRICPKN